MRRSWNGDGVCDEVMVFGEMVRYTSKRKGQATEKAETIQTREGSTIRR